MNGWPIRQRLAARDGPHRRSVDAVHSERRRLNAGCHAVRERVSLQIGLDRNDIAERLQRGDVFVGEVRREAVDARQLAQVALIGGDSRVETR